MKKLSIIIVNYNVKHFLRQCLDSVERAIKDIDADVYVVDNHSRDDSVTFLKPRYPNVNFIESNHNLGFARANNIAIRQSESEYVLLLNPDTIVGEHVLKNVLLFMDEHSDAGGAGVRMLKSYGESALESRRGLPTPLTAFYKMSGLCRMFPQSRRFGKYYMGYLPWDTPQKIEVISGAFCMLRRSVLDKIGLIDEDFFMYGEDIDLSYRIIKNGYNNYYVPEKILHYKGESTQKSSFRYVHVFYEAMLIFFRKHYSHTGLLITIPVRCAIYAKAAFTLLKMNIAKLKKSLGIFSSKGDYIPHYLFIGNSLVIEKCRVIAREKGLIARFYEGNSETIPDGHHSLSSLITPNHPTFIVYSTNDFSYETILNLFSLNPDPMILIATYDDKTCTIITQDETIIGNV